MDDKASQSAQGDAPDMRMRIGCRLRYRLTQPTPLIAMLKGNEPKVAGKDTTPKSKKP